jgi:hypothetical protein
MAEERRTASSGEHARSTGRPEEPRLTRKSYDIPKTLIWQAWLQVKADQGPQGIAQGVGTCRLPTF